MYILYIVSKLCDLRAMSAVMGFTLAGNILPSLFWIKLKRDFKSNNGLLLRHRFLMKNRNDRLVHKNKYPNF